MADSNIQTPDTVKPITLDEYEERTAHLQENTTSLLSAIADRQVQAAGLATQAYSLASEVNAVAEQASLSFSKKTWEDTATSGTPITAAELNRLENAISSLTTAVNNLQDSVSRLESDYVRNNVGSGSFEFCRVGGIVIMNMYNITAKVSGSWGTTLVGTVPEGFRPKNQLRQRCQVANTDSDRSSGLWVKSSGEMYIANFGGTGLSGSYSFSCTACWPAV